MEKIVEKFNAFDLFTMLIPGVIICTLFGVSFSVKYYDVWSTLGNEKYLLFLVFSYLCGILFQELGFIFDNRFMYKLLYGGSPREVFLLEHKWHKIFKDKILYVNASKIKDIFAEYVEVSEKMNDKQFNAQIFAYCLNYCEMKGIASKSERMIVISEMSRSIFWGCIACIFLNGVMFWIMDIKNQILLYEIPLLIILAVLFLHRKKRYEQYRIRILVRTFMLHANQNLN